MYKGCTSCPYAGHIELKECPDAYTAVSSGCRLYDRTEIPGSMPQAEFEALRRNNKRRVTGGE